LFSNSFFYRCFLVVFHFLFSFQRPVLARLLFTRFYILPYP
jgi:hypothetical protein